MAFAFWNDNDDDDGDDGDDNDDDYATVKGNS